MRRYNQSVLNPSVHLATQRSTPATESPSTPPTRTPAWRIWVWVLLAGVLVSAAGVSGLLIGLALSFRDLPDVRSLKNFVPSEATRITDIRGQFLATIHGDANRRVVPLRETSPYLQQAVLAIEDDRFYQHSGIRVDTVARAALANFQEGRTVQGGSTVTQQLVKNLFLTPKRSLERKVSEAVLSLRLEQVFSKDEILELYLNQVYWGNNNYGAEMAARTYFNKSARTLDLAEAALMAGLLRAPEVYKPLRNPDKAIARQNVVLDRMVELGWIAPAEAKKARAKKLKFAKATSVLKNAQAPYFTNYVVQELIRKYGRNAVLKGGLQVQTTLDLKLQALAEQTVRTSVKSLKGRRAEQMAIVSIDPRTGYVKAMVGGVDFKKSQFNRAAQSIRQPGSSFKPFVYYAAFATGKYTPDTIVIDSPATYPDRTAPGGRYNPKNYDLSYWGAMTVRRAVENSRNTVVVKIADRIGMKRVVEAAKQAGITTPLPTNLATSLGAAGTSPLILANAYSAFANGGWRVEPTVILQVTDQKGNVLEQNLPQRTRALKFASVKMVNDVLSGVITRGTATRARLADGRPEAGKTGTNQDFRDAWFVGYIPQMVTVVWIGNDNYQKPMARSTAGGTFVAPIWKSYMDKAIKGQPVLPFPGTELPIPEAKGLPLEEVPRRRARRSVVEPQAIPDEPILLKPQPEPTVPTEPEPLTPPQPESPILEEPALPPNVDP